MKKYDSYKDSGVEWLGLIPDKWEVVKFTHFVKIRHGHQFMNYDFTEEGVKIVKITQLHRDGYLDISNCSYVLPERVIEFENILIKNRDILMCLTGGTIGKIIRVNGVTEPLLQNYRVGHFSSARENEICDDYIFWLMSSESLVSQILFQMRETGQPNIGMEDFGRMRVLLPTLEEQTQIANYLDYKTTKIDDLISKKEKLIELLKEERIAIINQAVTKGLDPNVPMKDSGIEWLGEIPEHWEISRLKFLSRFVKTGSTPPTDIIEYFENGKIDWFGPGDFKNTVLENSKKKITELAINEGKARLYEANSILLVGIGATVGKVGICEKPCSSNQQINAITVNEEKYNPLLLVHYLKNISKYIVSEADSSTLPIFNQTQTKNIPICVPPISEQNQIVKEIQTNEINFKTLNDKLVKEIELLKEYKTALISEVVTGKVDVSTSSTQV